MNEKVSPAAPSDSDHFQSSVLTVTRRDAATLRQDLTVRGALEAIRRQGVGEKIVYFYVVDSEERLVGVLPTRRLLTAPLDEMLSEVMIRRVVAIPRTATVLEACESFILHKFLAFPVVDEERRVLGVVDVSLLTEEAFDIAEWERVEEVFESIGFRVSQVRGASPLRAFRYRFPWLAATITSGTLCALLAGAFEVTLAKSLILAFFLTMVLGLGESVSVQSMTVTIQALRSRRPTFGWYLQAFRNEIGTALLLGSACAVVVAFIVWAWRGSLMAAATIGGSILLSICGACVFGLSVPTLLHRLKLDPKIAAGPLTLALTDILVLVCYLGLAALVL